MTHQQQTLFKRHPLLWRMLGALVMLVLVLAGGLVWYARDYSHADQVALTVMADEDGAEDGVIVTRLSDGSVAFTPDDPSCGFVFYPGGKVEAEAYAPLLEQLAEQGILCVLVDPPLNLAMFDANAAKRAIDSYGKDVDVWLVGGHSLGGVVSCSYASRHAGDVSGIVLLAAYPSDDLTSFPGPVLTLVGSNDGVLNRTAYEDAQAKLPADAREVTIEGGNHAGFGNYGKQDGDGTATIAWDEQQRQTTEAICALAAEL